MCKNGRRLWVDYAKGMGITFVVIGHVISPTSYPCKFIYLFHMPLFFVLSGIVFDEVKYTLGEFVVHRFRQLMIPFVAFYLLSLPFVQMQPNFLWHDLLIDAPFTLWFLPVLYFAELFSFIICRNFRGIWSRITFYLFLFICGSILYDQSIVLPYSFSSLCPAIAFIGLGHTIMKQGWLRYIEVLFGGTPYILVFVAMLLSLWSFFSAPYDMHYNHLGGFMYGYVPCIIGSLTVIWASQRLCLYDKLFAYLGKKSLSIMCMHYPLFFFMSKYMRPQFDNLIIYKVLEFLTIIIIPLLLERILMRYMPIVLGKS